MIHDTDTGLQADEIFKPPEKMLILQNPQLPLDREPIEENLRIGLPFNPNRCAHFRSRVDDTGDGHGAEGPTSGTSRNQAVPECWTDATRDMETQSDASQSDASQSDANQELRHSGTAR